MPEADFTSRLQPDDLRHLVESPEISGQNRNLDIVFAVLLALHLPILALASLGIFQPVLPENVPRLWPVLVVVALIDLPVFFLIAARLLSDAAGKEFQHVAAAALPATLLPQVWCLTVGFFGLVSPLLGAVPVVVWAFLAAGLLLHLPVYLLFRGKAVDAMLLALARREREKR